MNSGREGNKTLGINTLTKEKGSINCNKKSKQNRYPNRDINSKPMKEKSSRQKSIRLSAVSFLTALMPRIKSKRYNQGSDNQRFSGPTRLLDKIKKSRSPGQL